MANKVNKVSNETREKIRKKSVANLPNKIIGNPELVKQAFTGLVIDSNNSALGEIDRVVDEVNAEFETYAPFKESVENLINDEVVQGIIASDIEAKLNAKEQEYAPRLINVENNKADKTALQAVASGSPKGVFNTLGDLEIEYPEGDTNIYINQADGNWYYWNGDAWVSGGVYQATGIAENSVTPGKTTFMSESRNIFNGIYHPLILGVPSQNEINYRGLFTGEMYKTAIIPIEPNLTYTAKLHEPELSDKFLAAIVNSYPNILNTNYTIADKLVNANNDLKSITFTNTATGKYLLLYVSSIGNEPLLQVEKGVTATNYIEHFLFKKEHLAIGMNNLDIEIVEEFDALNLAKNNIEEHIEVLEDTVNRTIGKQPNIQYLIEGKDTEELILSDLINSNIQPDLLNVKREKGWKINFLNLEPKLYGIYLRPSAWGVNPLVLPKWSQLCVMVYIVDATKIEDLFIQMHHQNKYNQYELETANRQLKNGWNLLRWDSLINYITPENEDLTKLIKVDMFFKTTSPTSVTIGSLFVMGYPKAQILFIHDGGYKAFFENGYPDFRDRKVPVTFALQPSRIGVLETYMTELELAEVGAENNNSITMHSFGDGVTNDMNSVELRADSIKCIQWLKNRGYTGYKFRAAWLQNLAPAHESCQSLFDAYAWATGGGEGVRINSYPFMNNYDVKRHAIHGYNDNPTGLIELFKKLELTNGLLVCYTHNVGVEGVSHTTTERWNQFLSLIDQGLNEGWLEGVTYEMLVARYGINPLGEYLE